ncbi:MAG: DinB family protein [Planctomycetales bacterium]|nr:DinB family protein [Planctomycetales bacterium]MBN8628716.1 DinB family protein [Planctomycetota bacterium]
MSTAETTLKTYEYYRPRTLAILDKVLQEPDPVAVLGWRPGPGRAHIAWQLMHIGVTEEIFATERLAPEKAGAFQDLWPRFRGGSTPDDDVPSPELIRKVLEESRAHLAETLRAIPDSRLGEIPQALAQRKLTIGDVLHLIGWHEAHHQGQAHITFNLYKASQTQAPR